MIKEYCTTDNGHTWAVIRDERYGSKLQKFIDFYNEALRDFPNLKIENVDVVKYGGERYSKTFGIEFEVLGWTVPQEYREIGMLEYTS